jgi:Peptidase family M28
MDSGTVTSEAHGAAFHTVHRCAVPDIREWTYNGPAGGMAVTAGHFLHAHGVAWPHGTTAGLPLGDGQRAPRTGRCHQPGEHHAAWITWAATHAHADTLSQLRGTAAEECASAGVPPRDMRWFSWAAAIRLAILLLLLGLPLFCAWRMMVHMPGRSFEGALPPLTALQQDLARELHADVAQLASTIGERNVQHPRQLAAAADFVAATLRRDGYDVDRQTFMVGEARVANLIAERAGTERAREIVVLGAHYDSVAGSPGANDNGSGVAALLVLAHC